MNSKSHHGTDSMQKIGEVKVILNDSLVLVSSQSQLDPNDIVVVFHTIESEQFEALGIEQPIVYPKGHLKIICEQSGGIYLAERYREVKHRTRQITEPNQLARSLMGMATLLGPATREVTEEIPGPWSAELDSTQALGIDIPILIRVGDALGRGT